MKTTFDLVMSKIDEFSIVELVFHYSTNEINHDTSYKSDDMISSLIKTTLENYRGILSSNNSKGILSDTNSTYFDNSNDCLNAIAQLKKLNIPDTIIDRHTMLIAEFIDKHNDNTANSNPGISASNAENANYINIAYPNDIRFNKNDLSAKANELSINKEWVNANDTSSITAYTFYDGNKNMSDVKAKQFIGDLSGTALNARALNGKDINDFAPSGFGIGENKSRVLQNNDLNTALLGGFYSVDKDTLNKPAQVEQATVLVFPKENGTEQLLIENATIPNMYIRIYTTDWSAWTKFSTEKYVDEKVANIYSENAGAHNAVYRGKDLTAYFDSGEMSKTISAGTFTDIFPGDYIIKSVTIDGNEYKDIKWIIGDLDYHINRGDTKTTVHHVLVFPLNSLNDKQANATDITTGGFIGSDIWKTVLPLYATGIKTAFGDSHILKHRELLSNTESDTEKALSGLTGATANSAWTDVEINLFNEQMVYGDKIYSSSNFDIGECNSKIAAIKYNSSLSVTDDGYWLRAIASATSFAIANNSGEANVKAASQLFGVRPYFLLY
jgi:hypothetical protein